MRPLPEPANIDNLVHRYIAGESTNKLAGECGVPRSTFDRWLQKRGVSLRNQSQAEAAKWARMDSVARAMQTKAAHDAVRGTVRSAAVRRRMAQGQQQSVRPRRTMTWEARAKRALTRAVKQLHISPLECAFGKLAMQRGVLLTPQFPIGAYNIDLADEAARIAVEIGNGRHRADVRCTTRHAERTKYILDQGWAMLFVWSKYSGDPFRAGSAEYLVAMHERLCGTVAARREYRVILGDGEDAPAIKGYFNTPAFVQSLGCSN